MEIADKIFNAIDTAHKKGKATAEIINELKEAYSTKAINDALYFSVMLNKPDTLCILIDAGGDINHSNDNGQSVLVAATIGPKTPAIECLVILLGSGANPLIEDINGFNAYDYAKKFNKVAKCLMENINEKVLTHKSSGMEDREQQHSEDSRKISAKL